MRSFHLENHYINIFHLHSTRLCKVPLGIFINDLQLIIRVAENPSYYRISVILAATDTLETATERSWRGLSDEYSQISCITSIAYTTILENIKMCQNHITSKNTLSGHISLNSWDMTTCRLHPNTLKLNAFVDIQYTAALAVLDATTSRQCVTVLESTTDYRCYILVTVLASSCSFRI